MDELTLRDWFAIGALVAWGAGRNRTFDGTSDDSLPPSVAASCYRYADAMLAHRKMQSDVDAAVEEITERAIGGSE